MNFMLQPWQLLLTILAGLISRQQQEVIEDLRTENQVRKESHGKRRIRLSDDQRRCLAVKGKVLGRKILGEIGTIFTPDTILHWHRQGALANLGHKISDATVGNILREHGIEPVSERKRQSTLLPYEVRRSNACRFEACSGSLPPGGENDGEHGGE
jgi:hypothetical protein